MQNEKPQKPDWYIEAEKNYNAMARVWNALPGNKLVWPDDKFTVKYCYCSKANAKPVTRGKFGSKHPYCRTCGFAAKV